MPPITEARKDTILRHCSLPGLHYPRLIPFLFSSVNEISRRRGPADGREKPLDVRTGGRKGITEPAVRAPGPRGPWPRYYLISFTLSSQYSSFPKAPVH